MNKKNEILIVDDEKLLVKGLRYSLEQEGYNIDVSYDGREALEKFNKKDYDIIVLDLMLPGIDGLEVCKKIRKTSEVPIIMLTAKGEDMDKVIGLEYGADDYLTKPFNILELKARLKAILRRTNISNNLGEQTIQVDDFNINTLGRKVKLGEKEINLTAKEFDLLLLLATNPGKVFTREDLLKTIWGYDYYGDLRTVDVHIRRLREKIEEDSGHAKYILTKWGVGYYFRDRTKK